MAGTLKGGRRAAATNKRVYGKDFYRRIGAVGGAMQNPNKGFGSNRKLASKAGRIGGALSRRGPASLYAVR